MTLFHSTTTEKSSAIHHVEHTPVQPPVCTVFQKEVTTHVRGLVSILSSRPHPTPLALPKTHRLVVAWVHGLA